jgi:ElaB/YqjD/DUF883 family membrane-anchored ribosome-binding protein
MYASELKDASRERLMLDLKSVISDIEPFISASAGETSEAYDVALGKLKTALDGAKMRIAQAQRAVVDDTRAATQGADVYVHENAWKAVAVAASVGFIAGVLVTRR